MTNTLISIGLMFYSAVVCVHAGFIDPAPALTLRSFSGKLTRLPCRFAVQGDEKVVQVTWSRQKPGGTREQLIIGHFTEGPTALPDFVNHVKFESSEPTLDSTLLIQNTKKSDQATYTCHISTYPSGNFERQISLTVWVQPISSLEPVVLEEGQSFRMAASCRSVGHPPPRLSWDTEIHGQSQNQSGEDGVVTSQFFLHPLRSMNGRRLDCLVWHPALDRPQRLQNNLLVHFPPDAVIAGSGSWRLGQTGAELTCAVKGNPQPQNITWTRKDGRLPEGVLIQGERLVFRRPLNITDQGVYVCQAENSVGSVKAEFKVEIEVLERTVEPASAVTSHSETLMIIIGSSVAGALVVAVVIIIIVVNCHLRRKNKMLKRALSVRTEEMISLSRQVSMRRLNSINFDPRNLTEECTLMRMDSNMKNSVLSVEDRSTLSDVRGRNADGDYDSLGRPAIYTPYRPERGSKRLREINEEEENSRRKVESYLKSNISLNSEYHREQISPPPFMSCGPAGDRQTDGEDWGRDFHREECEQREEEMQRERNPEGEEAKCVTDSYQISEAISNYFQCSNGGLTPKANPNAIIIHPHGQMI